MNTPTRVEGLDKCSKCRQIKGKCEMRRGENKGFGEAISSQFALQVPPDLSAQCGWSTTELEVDKTRKILSVIWPERRRNATANSQIT